jgi:hypothetical protein
LEGGDEAVGGQGGDADADPGEAAVLADALPDRPGTADLGERGEGEQQDRAQHGHGAEPMNAPTAARKRPTAP